MRAEPGNEALQGVGRVGLVKNPWLNRDELGWGLFCLLPFPACSPPSLSRWKQGLITKSVRFISSKSRERLQEF